MEKKDESYYNFKGLFKYISTVVTWTIFILLIIVGVLLIYYYISMRLYATKGERFEPKFSVYTIVSESMEPTINVYDVIVNTKIDSIDDVKINDVITFISSWNITYGMTITHRVVGTKTLDDGSKCLITRGDNNTQEDQSCVKESNIIGVVKAVIPGLGKIQHFLSTALGWLLIIIVPALYIIVKDILKIIKLAKKPKDDDSNLEGNSKKSDNEEKGNSLYVKNEKILKEKDTAKNQKVDEEKELFKKKNNNESEKVENINNTLKKEIKSKVINYNTNNKKLIKAYEDLIKVEKDK